MNDETNTLGKENVSQSIPHQDGRLSTASNTKIVTYEEATRRYAGTVISTPHGDPRPSESPFSPFQNSTDYGVAMYFHRRQLTKGDVDDFLRDESMQSLVDQLSFKNADEWRTKLLEIPDGLPLGNWSSAVATIETGVIGLSASHYKFYYQNIENVIRFLLGHTPFKDNLVYTPVRAFNENERRVYTEMHTADWWWQTQDKLPDGATVVPLLIAVDKTILTQHHGDLAAWPMYLTIGNLDNQTRRQQRRPSLIPIGFLPVTADQERAQKATLYHQVLRIILKRELYRFSISWTFV